MVLQLILSLFTALLTWKIQNHKTVEAYKEVKIGMQIWMTENLDVSTFSNGDTLFNAKTKKDWFYCNKNKIPAWCYYKNASQNNKYGKLYNWYAVVDQRKLAPKGWHIPSIEEWQTLNKHLGGSRSGSSLKLKAKDGWQKN